MKPTLKYISWSKKGLNREKNQDKILIIDNPDYYLFLVFDGVSSIPESHVFIHLFTKQLKLNLQGLISTGKNLDEVFFSTHNQVLKNRIEGKSTLSVLFYTKLTKKAFYINIGDSRIYQFSNQFIEKITIDDSFKGKANILTKCLGLSDLCLEDFKPKAVVPDSNFLLCTDGFYKLMLGDLKEYFKTYNFKHIKNIKKKLSILQRRKNNDDSSYILIKNEI